MTSINSAAAVQANNATALKKNVNNSEQQTQATGADFAQQLASASSALNATSAGTSVNEVAKAIAPAMDIGFDFNSNAIASSGLNSSEFLSQSLRSGIEAQFNTLGKDIAASFIAGLAGQDSATAKTPDSTATPAIDASQTTTPAVDAQQTATDSSIKNAAASVTEEATPALSVETETVANAQTSAEPVQSASSEETASTSIFPEALLNLFEGLSFLKNDDENSETETEKANAEQVNTVEQDVSLGEQPLAS